MDDPRVTERALASLLGSAMRDLPGDAVAIGASVDDVTEFACRGSLDADAVDQHTVFYGASLTKQMLGVAAADAVVHRLLDVDQRIVEWVSELPASMAAIRLDHLIHHTSDLPDVADPEAGVPADNAEVIQRLQQADLEELRPGARFAYNNAGYVLLAEALSRSRRRPANEIADAFIRSLGLADTRLGGPAVQLEGMPDPPGTIGDGGLWTSVADLTLWLQACNRSAFGTTVHELAESTTSLADGSPLDYAWGVRVTVTPAGRTITHGGSWHRWLAKTVRIPQRDIAVAIVSVGAAEPDLSRIGTDLATAIAALETASASSNEARGLRWHDP